MVIAIGLRKGPLIFLAILLGIISIAVGKALSLGIQWVNFALLGGLVIAYFSAIFFFDRKIILALYLLTIVNLDFIRLLSEPFNVTLDILFTLSLALLTLPLLLTKRFPWRKTPMQKAFLFYLAVTLICVVLSVEPLISLKRWFRYASYFFLLCLLLDAVRDKVTLNKFSRFINYSALIPCLIGYYGLFTRTEGLIGENLRFIYGIDMVRIKSTLSHANTFGLFLSIITTLIIGFLLKRTDRREIQSRFFLAGLLLLVLPMLYFTYSRIGWIVTSLAIFLTLILQKRWRLLTILPWLLGLFVWRIPGLVTRWSDIIDPARPDSLEWRRGLYIFSLNKFVQRPIFGSGPGTFLQYVAFSKGYAQHHLWIGSLVEVGIVGTLALFVLLGIVWVQLIKYVRRHPSILNSVTLSVFSAMMIVSFASDPFSVPSVFIYLWALIGLAEAEFRILSREANKAAPT